MTSSRQSAVGRRSRFAKVRTTAPRPVPWAAPAGARKRAARHVPNSDRRVAERYPEERDHVLVNLDHRLKGP